jgi:ribA/ribD-fused uncharacterized protein
MHQCNVHDIESLRAAVASGLRPTFLFFWGHTAKDGSVGKHVLSQWWPALFTVDGQSYPTAEHYMMAEKARLFGDAATRAQIIAAQSPAEVKTLGRQVRGFDEEHWVENRFAIALRGNIAKFGQNPELKDWLLGTAPAVLVEASPVDTIWGIGLGADDKRASDPGKWRGLNLLGFALMQAREALQVANS